MSTFPDGLYHYGGVPVGGIEAAGLGNVYYVAQTTRYQYTSDFYQSKKGIYPDGSQRLHNTLQAALTATSSDRNDYVIVFPDYLGYSITSTLSWAYKQHVTLICPSAMAGFDVGCDRGGVITMATTDTPVITLTGHHAQVAGLTIVNAASDAATSASGISAAASCAFYSRIHHNHFEMYTDGATNSPILGNATSGLAYSRIWNNKFHNYSGSGDTIAAVINIAANATAVDVVGNELHTNANTWTVGIANYSVQGMTKDNVVCAGVGATVSAAIGANAAETAIIGNRLQVATGEGLTGGTADNTFVDNKDAENGGAVEIET